MKNKIIVSVFASLIGMFAITTISLILKKNTNANVLEVNTTSITPASRIEAHAEWVSKAATINELMQESDLVVRVRVSTPPATRVLRSEIPVWDQNNNIVGSTVNETLFSDTVFDVIRTYWGEPRSSITVAQTGGFDPTVSKSLIDVIDDPLYKVDEEYILFLMDISGDSVHAPDRELYRIVNPFGRFQIEATNVFSYGQDSISIEISALSTVFELEAKIEEVAQELNKPKK